MSYFDDMEADDFDWLFDGWSSRGRTRRRSIERTPEEKRHYAQTQRLAKPEDFEDLTK